MHPIQKLIAVVAVAAFAGAPAGSRLQAQAQSQGAQASAGTKSRLVGSITAISGNSLTIKTDSGAEARVSVEDDARLLQAAPGQKDLSAATPIHLSDLQVGDRVLARVSSAEDGNYEASTLIAMKQSDIARKQATEQQDWQHRGVGGLVKSVDPATHVVVIAVTEPGGAKAVTIHVAPNTIVRRYAPDSVKFDDARPSTLEQIKPGDQLRARGDRSADGGELTAEEVVSGSFQNIAATVVSSDPAGGTLTVKDLATKKTATIRISADSQLRRLPPAMAQGIAMRLKGVGNGSAGSPPAGGAGAGAAPAEHPHASNQPRGTAAPGGQARSGDMQQMLSHAPEIHLADLNKGDAVMVVTTEGSGAGDGTAVTLLAGVEPMLQASTSASQSMLMASWNLSGNGGQDAQQ